MNIAAITPCTLLDFPDTPSCILFTQGCNFRCTYCHNPEMVDPRGHDVQLIPWETVLNFLERRQGMLEGVVLCGGEPTLQPGLIDAIGQIRTMGFKVKLDTNGSNPEILKKVLPLVQYVAMDFKTTGRRLEELCKAGRFEKQIHTSLQILLQSRVPYEIRTTVIASHHNEKTMQTMATFLRKAPKWNLQAFRPECTLETSMEKEPACTEHDLKTRVTALQGLGLQSVTHR